MNDATTPPITSASVKVMRSYDYCHFEVVLGTTSLDATGCAPLIQIDNLRKEAARLADKAVKQYKIAKKQAEEKEGLKHGYLRMRAKSIAEIPEENRSVEDKATLKAFQDAVHRANRGYDYEDDWQAQEDDEEDLAPGY